MDKSPSPQNIMQLGLGFWASKTVLTAVELGVFTHLSVGPLSAVELTTRLDIHPRGALDFLDALVALRLLERKDGFYSNALDAAIFLDRNKPSYIGGILEMANSRLYGFWGQLTEALRTGSPQNEAKEGINPFEVLYADPDRLESFLKAMSGISLGSAGAISQKFPWADYGSVVDIGCAQGAVPVQLANDHQHLTGGGFDLPVVKPVFLRYVAQHGLTDRLKFYTGSFFSDPLPQADVLVMGHILHDWDLAEKKQIIEAAYRALPDQGVLIVYDAIIDDLRQENAFGLLMSLNMLIETPGGFDYTGADCQAWLRAAGFKEVRQQHLLGPDSMIVATK